MVGEVIFLPGTERTYEWTLRRFERGGVAGSDTTETFRVRVASTDDAVAGLVGLIRLEAWSELKPSSGKTYGWYRQSPDSLEEVAYAWVGRVPVILPKGGAPLLGGGGGLSPFFLPRSIADIDRFVADSVIVRTNPRLVLRYPAQKGRWWIAFVDPFLQTREVVGVEEIATPAGQFLCLKILTRLPEVAPMLEWYDYVNRYGLVAREIAYTLIRTDGAGQPTDTVQVVETMHLKSY
jgi:hypothetical protein